MHFTRVFTEKPDDITWTKKDSKITDSNGNIVFELKDVEAPSFYSDNARNIIASKYFKKIHGVQETSVKQLIKRVVTTIKNWGIKDGYFEVPATHLGDFPADVFEDELTWLLTNQYACFNSPIWFNFGVPGREQQAAACFLLGLEDNSESIRTWTSIESKIFKGGSGSGINISPLRPKGAPLSSGGFSSGPMSFAKGADANAGVWKSGGTTRRAAKLVRMDVSHGDIIDFITCKAKEELKAQILIAAGYDGGIDGEAYNTVAFQNMNHSVGVTDDFVTRAINGEKEATDILQLMAKCAWESGDPGIQYDDIINSWNTIPNSGRITTSNPCGEYLSTDWSSCLLSSFNLLKFRIEHEGLVGFDFAKFSHAVHIFTTALDIIIGNADYPDERFKKTAHKQRQIGLGYANLGALLMSMGLPYGSDEGRALARKITSTMTAQAYIQSANLAAVLGPFEDFDKNRSEMLSIIDRQRELSLKEDANYSDWQEASVLGHAYGYRNSNVSLIAPTGTISFMMDCDTTGIESEIALAKYKKLVGGGTMQLVNQTVVLALKTLGYTPQQIETIVECIASTGTIENCPEVRHEDLAVFDCSFKPANGNRFIDYNDHLKMVAAVQPYLSMGISKTINMPNSATIEDIYKVLIDGWKLGIKSVSVYRDGSKLSQPLNVSNVKTVTPATTVCPPARRPLPAERLSITHKMEVSGFEFYLHVGLFEDNTPGEIFINSSKLGSTLSGLLDSFAIAISFGLQYGVPLESLVEKFTNTRFEPAGFTQHPEIKIVSSIVDYIFRWLKLKFLDKEKELELEYIVHTATPAIRTNKQSGADSKISEDLCKCGNQMIRTGTCYTCRYCGTAAGGCGA